MKYAQHKHESGSDAIDTVVSSTGCRTVAEHTFRSADGDLYTIERDSSGELSWDFSTCENRIEALVAEIWRLKEQNDRLQENVPQ